MVDAESALKNPSNVFANPQQVLEASDLSVDKKLAILRQWEYDVREMEVAEEENMQGINTVALDEVLQALKRLGGQGATHQEHFTKQG